MLPITALSLFAATPAPPSPLMQGVAISSLLGVLRGGERSSAAAQACALGHVLVTCVYVTHAPGLGTATGYARSTAWATTHGYALRGRRPGSPLRVRVRA